MRICMIGQKGVPCLAGGGGIETHVAELGSSLVHAGHDVVVYSRRWYAPAGESLMDGMRIVRLPSVHTKHADTITHVFLSTLHAALVVRPDVYHFHGVGPALFSWIPRLLAPSAAVIATFHSLDAKNSKWGAFARAILRVGERAITVFPHATIAVGKSLRHYLQRQFAADSVMIPNGVRAQCATVDHLLLSPWGLEPMGYVLAVSRLIPSKGLHTLVDAWKLARAQRPDLFAALRLAIVGDAAFTQEYARALHAHAADDGSIVFTGRIGRESMGAFYMGARCVAHPSTVEGLPIAVLEAMSYGKAVLAADIPENMELVGEHGCSFAAGDAADCASQLITLIEDPMRAAAIGHVAREFVEQEYAWPQIADATIALYEQYLPRPQVAPALQISH